MICHTEFSARFKGDTARSSSAVKMCSTADFLRAMSVCRAGDGAQEVHAIDQTSSNKPAALNEYRMLKPGRVVVVVSRAQKAGGLLCRLRRRDSLLLQQQRLVRNPTTALELEQPRFTWKSFHVQGQGNVANF